MKRSNYNNIKILLVLVTVSVLYAAIWVRNGLYLDMEYYWEEYRYFRDHGVSETITAAFIHTGKLEVGIIYVYGLLDLLDIAKPFGFLFFMFLATQSFIFLAIKSSTKSQIAPVLLLIILLSHFSFSQNTYVWRQIFGIAIAIYGLNQSKMSHKFILIAIACIFHYSSILIPPVWWIAGIVSKKGLRSYLILAPVIFFGMKYFANLAELFAGSSTSQILHETSNYDIVIYITIFISMVVLLVYRSNYSKKFNNTTLVDFSLIFCLLAISGTGNQFIARTFTPASLAIPYVLAMIGTPSAVILLTASTYTVAGLVFKIAFLGLRITS